MKTKMSYAIAMAAGRDASNRSMRAAGRTVWNEEDYAAGVEVFHKCMPVTPHA